MWKYQEKYVYEEYHRGTTLQDLFLKVTEKEAGTATHGSCIGPFHPGHGNSRCGIMK